MFSLCLELPFFSFLYCVYIYILFARRVLKSWLTFCSRVGWWSLKLLNCMWVLNHRQWDLFSRGNLYIYLLYLWNRHQIFLAISEWVFTCLLREGVRKNLGWSENFTIPWLMGSIYVIVHHFRVQKL